jgi:hypothetical protein
VLDLVDKLESSIMSTPSAASSSQQDEELDPAEVLKRQLDKLDKHLELIPDKRITKPMSCFMVNELMPAEAIFAVPPKGFTKTQRNLKKGTKQYEKKFDEMKRLLEHLFKVYETDMKVQEDIRTLYTRLNTDGHAEEFFFACEGQRQLEGVMFLPKLSPGSFVATLALYNFIMKLPSYSTDNLLFQKGRSSFTVKLLETFCLRPELHVQRASLYMLANIAEMLGHQDTIIFQILNQFHKDHKNSLHPIGTVVDIMVTHRDGVVISSGLKLVNNMIRVTETCGKQDVLSEILQSTSYHRAMVQFTKSPTAQALEGISVGLKKYQAWYLRDIKKRLVVKFSLAVPEHLEMLKKYWALRHSDKPCPASAESSGFDENKELWMDVGFFNDPCSYLTNVIRMEDLLHFASTRTHQWNGVLDKLSATRKMAEKAKGATIGKVDFDVAALSTGITARIVELISSPAPLIPAQQILWQDSGRIALHSAGMEMARTVFTSYKFFDRANTKQLLDDTMGYLLGALQSVPPNEDHLHRLMTFFGSRSTEQERQRTLRGGGAGRALAGSGVIPSKSNSAANLLMKEAALQMAAGGAPGGMPGAAGMGGGGASGGKGTEWKMQFERLYKQSLDDMEPGPDGVPKIVACLTEAILSCGGESSVGLFRLQPSSEALEAVEERLDSGGANPDVFRNVTDPNIPGMVLKRLLTALDPPIIDKYNAVVDAVRLNQFGLLMQILKKLDPVNKATLNYLMQFLRYLADPAIAEVTKMDAANMAMVFAPTILRDETRGDRPSLGGSFLEKDCILYLAQVVDKIP